MCQFINHFWNDEDFVGSSSFSFFQMLIVGLHEVEGVETSHSFTDTCNDEMKQISRTLQVAGLNTMYGTKNVSQEFFDNIV